MKKNVKRYHSFNVLLTLGMIIANLLSCATSDINSDARENQIILPKITSDEHERLGDLELNRGKLFSAFMHYEKSLLLNPVKQESVTKRHDCLF